MATQQAVSNPVETLFSAIEAAAQERQFRNSRVVRTDGGTIKIPTEMSLEYAIKKLEATIEEEESIVGVHHAINCLPPDGAIALMRVLERQFGGVEAMKATMFQAPPTLVSIRTGPGPEDFESVLWGRISFAGLEKGEELQCYGETIAGKPAFVISGDIKRKHQEIVLSLAQAVEAEVRNNSIYRGRIIRLQLFWMAHGRSFNAEQDAPQFVNDPEMTLDDVIMPEGNRQAVVANLLLRIFHPERCIAQNVPISTSMLFAGEYGTGKSLTGSALASVAVDKGWTFMYLENPQHLKEALELAEVYETEHGGVIIFCEDLEEVAGKRRGGNRSRELNSLLSQMDGIDTKRRKTILVMTTNYPDNIEAVLLRAGRTSALIDFNYPTPDLIPQFLRMYGSDKVQEAAITDEAVVEALAGTPPAFIEAIIQRAVSYKMATIPEDQWPNSVSAADILSSYDSYKRHISLAAYTDEKEVVEGRGVLEELIGYATEEINEETNDRAGSIQSDVGSVYHRVGHVKNDINSIGKATSVKLEELEEKIDAIAESVVKQKGGRRRILSK